MTPIVRLFVGIGLMAALLLAVAYALPRQVAVARAIAINAPEADVFAHVNDLRLYAEWSPWTAGDSDASVVFSEPAAGVGAEMAWRGASGAAAHGSAEIVDSQANALVRLRLDLDDEPAIATYRLSPSGAGTRVTWTFDGDMGNNPLRRWNGLLRARGVGDVHERALERLKRAVEAGR